MFTAAGHEDQMLTPIEVARRARIKRRTIYRLIARRQLPAVRVGGQWRIPESAVRDLLTPKTTAPTALHTPAGA